MDRTISDFNGNEIQTFVVKNLEYKQIFALNENLKIETCTTLTVAVSIDFAIAGLSVRSIIVTTLSK